MRFAILAAASIAALAFAGCTAPSAPPLPANPYDAIEAAIGAPLAQGDRPSSALHHYNLEPMAQVQGAPGRAPQPTETYIASAVKGGYAYLARTGPQSGLEVFDVHDVEHPVFLSHIGLDAGFEAEVEVSDDGHWAFWETQRVANTVETPDPTAPQGMLPHGIHVIDVADKASPRWVSFTPILPDGPHSITYANITGRHIVFASTYSWAYVLAHAALPGMQREVILELDTSLPVPVLRTLAEYQDPDAAEPLMAEGGKFPHDVSVSVHPVTGQTLAYIAYWNLGVVIVDVTDPAHPTKVGQTTDFGPAPYRNIHMARAATGLIDGRVVLVAEPEIGGEPDSGYITFLDATDPAKPAYISSWRMPGNYTTAGGYGPHYFDFKDGRVAMAHYAAGFWVIDVHDAANLQKPRTVAFAEVNATDPSHIELPIAFGGPNAWDAWWADATHVVGTDLHGGLDVFRYTGPAPPIDEPAPLH